MTSSTRCVARPTVASRSAHSCAFDRDLTALLSQEGGGFWSIRSEHRPGDLAFDPLGLMPTDAEAREQMETKELNHGRLAMIGIAGMVVQELVTGSKLF